MNTNTFHPGGKCVRLRAFFPPMYVSCAISERAVAGCVGACRCVFVSPLCGYAKRHRARAPTQRLDSHDLDPRTWTPGARTPPAPGHPGAPGHPKTLHRPHRVDGGGGGALTCEPAP